MWHRTRTVEVFRPFRSVVTLASNESMLETCQRGTKNDRFIAMRILVFVGSYTGFWIPTSPTRPRSVRAGQHAERCFISSHTNPFDLRPPNAKSLRTYMRKESDGCTPSMHAGLAVRPTRRNAGSTFSFSLSLSFPEPPCAREEGFTTGPPKRSSSWP